MCHFWANCHTHLRKADLTVLKETKVAEQEETMGQYFGSVMSSVNQNPNFQVLFAALFKIVVFWLVGFCGWSSIIHSPLNSSSPLKSSWLKRNPFQSWVRAVINWPGCRSDGFLGNECSVILFYSLMLGGVATLCRHGFHLSLAVLLNKCWIIKNLTNQLPRIQNVSEFHFFFIRTTFSDLIRAFFWNGKLWVNVREMENYSCHF